MRCHLCKILIGEDYVYRKARYLMTGEVSEPYCDACYSEMKDFKPDKRARVVKKEWYKANNTEKFWCEEVNPTEEVN